MSNKYIPRNDFVLIRIVEVDKSEGGVVLPSMSQQSKSYRVVAFGPKVTDLKVGDEVQMMGAVGEDIALLPREKGLCVTKEQNIIYVIQPEE